VALTRFIKGAQMMEAVQRLELEYRAWRRSVPSIHVFYCLVIIGQSYSTLQSLSRLTGSSKRRIVISYRYKHAIGKPRSRLGPLRASSGSDPKKDTRTRWVAHVFNHALFPEIIKMTVLTAHSTAPMPSDIRPDQSHKIDLRAQALPLHVQVDGSIRLYSPIRKA